MTLEKQIAEITKQADAMVDALQKNAKSSILQPEIEDEINKTKDGFRAKLAELMKQQRAEAGIPHEDDIEDAADAPEEDLSDVEGDAPEVE